MPKFSFPSKPMGVTKNMVGGRKFSPPRLKLGSSMKGRRNSTFGPKLASSIQIDKLEKIRKILNQPSGYLPTDKEAANDEEKSTSRVKVAVRVRPMNKRELANKANGNILNVVVPNMLIFDPKPDEKEYFYDQGKQRDLNTREYKTHKFAFDYVYDTEISNEYIFKELMQPVLNTLMTGVNCSVFAYGTTGSGKTYTMLGNPTNVGLTYLTMDELFKRLEEAEEEFESELVISYFEVYNEQVRDLLNYTGEQLQIREAKSGVMQVAGLSYHKCTEGVNEVLGKLMAGDSHRSQHATQHNTESSRSHALLQVHIQLRKRSTGLESNTRRAKLVMVDLAGSERGTATSGTTVDRSREGSSINRSLLALGNCINALAAGRRHVTYRDSKLTRILKDSLGGNCKTVMIANVSPSFMLYNDTLNTLRYAEKAKKISCDVKKNTLTVQSCLSQYSSIVDEMASKIEKLQSQLTELKSENDTKSRAITELRSESDTKSRAITDLRSESDTKSRAITDLRSESDTKSRAITELQSELQARKRQLESLLGAYEDHYYPIMKNTDRVFGDPVIDNVKEKEPIQILRMRNCDSFVNTLEEDLKAKSEIRTDVSTLLHRYQLANLKFELYSKLNDSMYHGRLPKAVKRAENKLISLVKQVETPLAKVEDYVRWNCRGRLGYIYDFYPELWKTELKKEGAWRKGAYTAFNITPEQLFELLLQRASKKDLESENQILKSQLREIKDELTKKDSQITDSTLLIKRLISLVKHHGHETPTLLNEYEKMIQGLVGHSVQFLDGVSGECSEEDNTPVCSQTSEEFIVTDPIQFYIDTVDTVNKTLMTTHTKTREIWQNIKKDHEDQCEYFREQKDFHCTSALSILSASKLDESASAKINVDEKCQATKVVNAGVLAESSEDKLNSTYVLKKTSYSLEDLFTQVDKNTDAATGSVAETHPNTPRTEIVRPRPPIDYSFLRPWTTPSPTGPVAATYQKSEQKQIAKKSSNNSLNQMATPSPTGPVAATYPKFQRKQITKKSPKSLSLNRMATSPRTGSVKTAYPKFQRKQIAKKSPKSMFLNRMATPSPTESVETTYPKFQQKYIAQTSPNKNKWILLDQLPTPSPPPLSLSEQIKSICGNIRTQNEKDDMDVSLQHDDYRENEDPLLDILKSSTATHNSPKVPDFNASGLPCTSNQPIRDVQNTLLCEVELDLGKPSDSEPSDTLDLKKYFEDILGSENMQGFGFDNDNMQGSSSAHPAKKRRTDTEGGLGTLTLPLTVQLGDYEIPIEFASSESLSGTTAETSTPFSSQLLNDYEDPPSPEDLDLELSNLSDFDE